MKTTLGLAQSDLLQGIRYFFEQAADRPVVTLIELLLIGSVVYAILRFLEGTRGARLVRAVLIILAVSFAVVWLVAERFAFERINALYPYFIVSVLLVSLVAFNVELRRLLLRLGEGAWLRQWLGRGDDIVEPIVVAARRLSKKKIGAIIAIERSGEAGAIAETGVRLDAVVTAELLETIFWPGSALHDLGVMITEGRVRAAGCQFPLTDSDEVDRALGSRHRAAVGMSQETDAVVVVVSEETGSISVVVRGRLRRAIPGSELREILVTELAIAVRPPPTNAGTAGERESPTSASNDEAEHQSTTDVVVDKAQSDGVGGDARTSSGDAPASVPDAEVKEEAHKDGAGQAA